MVPRACRNGRESFSIAPWRFFGVKTSRRVPAVEGDSRATLDAVRTGLAVLLLAATAFGQRTREVVDAGPAKIEVIAEGKGPVIVLLASLGRDPEEFDSVAERLVRGGFRVLRPEPRGWAKSEGPLERLTLHDLAKDLAAVLRHEHSGPAILAGHAFGHFVAKMTAVDFPELVRGVILIGAAQKTPDPAVQKAVAIASDPGQPEADRLAALKRVFFAPGNDPTPWLQGFHEAVQKSEAAARDATPQKEYWTGGTAPILDIQGADDPYRPPSSRNELVEEFGAKRVQTALIPRAAHAVIVEQPDLVSRAIINWAKRLP